MNNSEKKSKSSPPLIRNTGKSKLRIESVSCVIPKIINRPMDKSASQKVSVTVAKDSINSDVTEFVKRTLIQSPITSISPAKSSTGVGLPRQPARRGRPPGPTRNRVTKPRAKIVPYPLKPPGKVPNKDANPQPPVQVVKILDKQAADELLKKKSETIVNATDVKDEKGLVKFLQDALASGGKIKITTNDEDPQESQDLTVTFDDGAIDFQNKIPTVKIKQESTTNETAETGATEENKEPKKDQETPDSEKPETFREKVMKNHGGRFCYNRAIKLLKDTAPAGMDEFLEGKIKEDIHTNQLPGTQEMYTTPNKSYVNRAGRIKRPMNAFMIWSRLARTELSDQHPDYNNSQISIKLGEIWNTMTEKQKQPFYIEAHKVKKTHSQQFPDWSYRPDKRKMTIPRVSPQALGIVSALPRKSGLEPQQLAATPGITQQGPQQLELGPLRPPQLPLLSSQVPIRPQQIIFRPKLLPAPTGARLHILPRPVPKPLEQSTQFMYNILQRVGTVDKEPVGVEKKISPKSNKPKPEPAPKPIMCHKLTKQVNSILKPLATLSPVKPQQTFIKIQNLTVNNGSGVQSNMKPFATGVPNITSFTPGVQNIDQNTGSITPGVQTSLNNVNFMTSVQPNSSADMKSNPEMIFIDLTTESGTESVSSLASGAIPATAGSIQTMMAPSNYQHQILTLHNVAQGQMMMPTSTNQAICIPFQPATRPSQQRQNNTSTAASRQVKDAFLGPEKDASLISISPNTKQTYINLNNAPPVKNSTHQNNDPCNLDWPFPFPQYINNRPVNQTSIPADSTNDQWYSNLGGYTSDIDNIEIPVVGNAWNDDEDDLYKPQYNNNRNIGPVLDLDSWSTYLDVNNNNNNILSGEQNNSTTQKSYTAL